MSPDPELDELRQLASNGNENCWFRKAAGRAFGERTSDKLSSEELKELALSGSTVKIRAGTSRAWSRKLIRSDKTKKELLRMVSAATGFAPLYYRSAFTIALANRIFKTSTSIQGG